MREEKSNTIFTVYRSAIFTKNMDRGAKGGKSVQICNQYLVHNIGNWVQFKRAKYRQKRGKSVFDEEFYIVRQNKKWNNKRRIRFTLSYRMWVE